MISYLRHAIVFFVFLLIFQFVFTCSARAVSINRFVSAGNYSDILNWSNLLLPLPGDIVIIEQNCNVNLPIPLLGSLTVNSGVTLNLNTLSLPLITNIVNNGTIKTQSILPNPIPDGIVYGGNVEYSGNLAQNIVNAVYTNLTVSGQGNKNLTASLTVSNNLNLLNGTLKIGDNTLTVKGLINYSGGLLKGGNFSNLIIDGLGAQLSLQSITLANLTLNRPSGVLLLGDLNIFENLEIISGDIELNGQVITLETSAQLIESAGNTVKGLTGYITTTRNLSNINALNVGGLGAVISTAADMGSTTITRSHAPLLGNSNQGILRSFNISPTFNINLHASVTFRYDESELNGILETSLTIFRSTNLGLNWTLRGGIIFPDSNDVFVSVVEAFSTWTAASKDQPLVLEDLNLTVLPEGLYNPSTNLMLRDTVTVKLRSSVAPYCIIESSNAFLSQSGHGLFKFRYAVEGVGYFLEVNHRNSLDTWSASPNYFSSSILNYDFTTNPEKAYGSNMKLSGSKYVIYGGDVSRDGSVDLSDINPVFNDAGSFLIGSRITDLNGDEIVDLTDLLIVNGNSDEMIVEVTP